MRIGTLSLCDKTCLSRTLAAVLLQLMCVATAAHRSTCAPQTKSMDKPDVNHVIAEFTKSESEFRTAIGHYRYRWDLLVQSTNGVVVTGEFHRVSQVFPENNGKPMERITSFPPSTLNAVNITQEDLRDLSAAGQFRLDTYNAGNYKFSYGGQEQLDGQDVYLFNVKPKGLFSDKNGRFNGKIWVSVKESKIVKLLGRFEQPTNQKSPVLEMTRTSVDGNMFPSRTSADDTLTFPTGAVHVLVEVKYTDYVKGR